MKSSLLGAICACLLAVPLQTHAQRTIKGKVVLAEENTPIPGVSVVIEGTTVGTLTDKNGAYTIKLPPDSDKLLFSCIGLSYN